MEIKIIITRTVPKEKQDQLRPLLLQLRALATSQPGYISGETLRNMDSPEEYLVISTWKSKENWDAWYNSPQRQEVQKKIDAMLGQTTTYARYLYG